jgi:hypothetical protein
LTPKTDAEIDWEDGLPIKSKRDLAAAFAALRSAQCEFLFLEPQGRIWLETETPKHQGDIGHGKLAPAPLPFHLPEGIASLYVDAGEKVSEGFYIYNSTRFTESEMLKHLGIERRQ